MSRKYPPYTGRRQRGSPPHMAVSLTDKETALLSLHYHLTRALPLGGVRQLGEGRTTEELAVEAAFANELRPIISELYLTPLSDGGVEAIPDLPLQALIAWLLSRYEESTAVTDSLGEVLGSNFISGFNVGGTLALEALDLSGSFALANEEWLELIESASGELSSVGGEFSLVNTTANELGSRIVRGREDDLSVDELAASLLALAVGRSLTRSSFIAETEVVRWSRRGLGTTFSQNDVEFMIYRTDPAATLTGPCPICEPFEGQRFRATAGRTWLDLIPQHPGCACYYEPDISEWLPPDDIWLGG